MPIIKSAKKKLRQDQKRTLGNKKYEADYKKAIKAARKTKSKSELDSLIKKAFSAIDRAIKKKVIHKNKGARLKSGIAKLAKQTQK